VSDTETGKGSEVTYLPASSVAVFSPSAGNGLVPGGRSLAAGPGEAEFNVEGVEAPPEVAGVDTDWAPAPGAGVDRPALGVPPEEELPHPASTTAVTALAAHTVSRRFDGIESSSGTIEPWAPLVSHLGVLDEVPVDRGSEPHGVVGFEVILDAHSLLLIAATPPVSRSGYSSAMDPSDR
jgi:hypothetical protein